MNDTNSLPRCAICGNANGIMDRNVMELSIVRGPGQRTLWTVMACERCAVSLVERQHALQALRGKYAGVLPSVDEYQAEKRAEAPAPKCDTHRFVWTGTTWRCERCSLVDDNFVPACEHEWIDGAGDMKGIRWCLNCGTYPAAPKPEPAPAREWTPEMHALVNDLAGLVPGVRLGGDIRPFKEKLREVAPRFVRVKLPPYNGYHGKGLMAASLHSVGWNSALHAVIAALREQGVEVESVEVES